MKKYLFTLLFGSILVLNTMKVVTGENTVPYLNLSPEVRFSSENNASDPKVPRHARDSEPKSLEYLPFEMLINQDKDRDTSDYWRETEILSLVRNRESRVDYERCVQSPHSGIIQFASERTIHPICQTSIDHQLCPQCPYFNNHTECELFRDSCKERKVHPSEYSQYCDQKYGKFRTMFMPADYSKCRCCDECIPFREMDQSCMQDEYSFDTDEFLPVTSLDFRAGCNPYWGHPEQELKALRCDDVLRRCVPVNIPRLPNETVTHFSRRNYRFQPPTSGHDCPMTCRGYNCFGGLVKEQQCAPGAFLPHKEQCNCCGMCSAYHQLNEKCANFKKTIHVVNNTTEVEIEEEFLDPGCDDGLVCRQGRCQDIHTVQAETGSRRKRDEGLINPNEPCKKEMKNFKKKYGQDGHLHYNAPQCTPLWLYAPVQCRGFVCYCSLEDGTLIEGIKVPRVEVSNMNCDCAREKCRTASDLECDGYGNYKKAVFLAHTDDWPEEGEGTTMSADRATLNVPDVTPSQTSK